MPLNPSPDTNFGNLQAYKFYIRPTSHKLFGSLDYRRKTLTKHQENVQKLLKILAFEGVLTTWEMAKSKFNVKDSTIRTKEKEFRRLLVGREDRGKRSPGIVDIGLVIKNKDYNRGPSSGYRLSLHGILYCLEIFDFNKEQIDNIAKKYSKDLPKVFGRWDYLKAIVGDDVYKIKFLAKGLILDNNETVKVPNVPFYELMSYITIKYKENFDYISEEQLADQISYWFYTNLLFSPESQSSSRKIPSGIRKLRNVFKNDSRLHDWYHEFFLEARQFYKNRYKSLRESIIFR